MSKDMPADAVKWLKELSDQLTSELVSAGDMLDILTNVWRDGASEREGANA